MKAIEEINPDEGFLQAILNAIPSGVFVTDLEHNILLINRAGAEMANRTPGDCFDRKCYEVFDTFICKTDFCNCRLAVHKDEEQHGVTIIRVNDKEIPIEYASLPLKNFEGKIIGCVEHFVDISDRLAKEKTITEQHEQVLQLLKEKSIQNIKLNQTNAELFQLSQDIEELAQERTVTEMALQIADRIRNPATAIGGLTHILARQLPEEIAQSKKFQAILKEVKKLEERVNSFEKLAQKQKKLFVREDLRQIIAEIINDWSSALNTKEITFVVRKPAKPIKIAANRRTLKIALQHIFRNAVEASCENGEIKIEIAMQNDRPLIKVTDQGCGMPLEVKNKLFTKPADVRSEQGGMGLLLVKQIIKEHQGDLTVDSCEGRGTTVTVLFPCRWEEKT